MANYTIDKILYNGNIYNILQPTPMSTAIVQTQVENGWGITLDGTWAMKSTLVDIDSIDIGDLYSINGSFESNQQFTFFDSFLPYEGDITLMLQTYEIPIYSSTSGWNGANNITIYIAPGGGDLNNINLLRWFIKNGVKMS